jgi:hypothetical protein
MMKKGTMRDGRATEVEARLDGRRWRDAKAKAVEDKRQSYNHPGQTRCIRARTEIQEDDVKYNSKC